MLSSVFGCDICFQLVFERAFHKFPSQINSVKGSYMERDTSCDCESRVIKVRGSNEIYGVVDYIKGLYFENI